MGTVLITAYPRTDSNTLGIAVSEDLVVLAFINEEMKLTTVKFFAHESGTAFKRCTYFSEWKKHVTTYGDDFNLGRLLEDQFRGKNAIGYDPGEIKFKTGRKDFFAVPKDHDELDDVLGWMQAENFVYESEGAATRDPTSRGAFLNYYWGSLRISDDGKRHWSRPTDRSEPIYAIANGLIAAAACADMQEAEEAEARRVWEEQRVVREAQANEELRLAAEKRRLDEVARIMMLAPLQKLSVERGRPGWLKIRRVNEVVEFVSVSEAHRLLRMKFAEFVP